MKWKLCYSHNGVEVIKRLSGWVKVQEFIRDNPELAGKVWERVSKRPRSQRRAAACGQVVDGYTLFCSFAAGHLG